jgi:hypothetical protein
MPLMAGPAVGWSLNDFTIAKITHNRLALRLCKAFTFSK